jgi:CspA family cold shock protein
MDGRISRFFEQRGFGFITPDSGGADIFVHISAATRDGEQLDSLREGDRVSYEVGNSPRQPDKPMAVRVKLLEG